MRNKQIKNISLLIVCLPFNVFVWAQPTCFFSIADWKTACLSVSGWICCKIAKVSYGSPLGAVYASSTVTVSSTTIRSRVTPTTWKVAISTISYENTYGKIRIHAYDKGVHRFNPRKEKFEGVYSGKDASRILPMNSGKVWLTSDAIGCICVQDFTFAVCEFSPGNGKL